MIDPKSPNFASTPAADDRPAFDYRPLAPDSLPAVSIVTPFYNTEEVFEETATSVLRQSLQQWEWLIVNDGSTNPAALAVLDRYRKRDPRIRVIDLDPNRGLSAARNVGYRAARAPYVLQLDSDDLLEPTAAEKWYWFLESNPQYGFVKGYSVGFGAQEYLWQNGFHERATFLERNLIDPTALVRREVHEQAGGYDESIREGLEDWDFWLRCAHSGHWGDTIREYLDWYRRRPSHSERWSNWDGSERQQRFEEQLRARYAGLWQKFPEPATWWHDANERVSDDLPCENRLAKGKPRLLLVVPWLTLGGADKFNLDLVERLTANGWEITIATTLRGDHWWLPEFQRHTPDIFVLSNFLRLTDYPRFLRYLIRSRSVDAVLVTHSELGYLLLPYLRAHAPDVAFLDYCHIEEEYWKNGGYPRLAVEYQSMLDLNVVASGHLKKWMTERGADPDRIEVCHINVDADYWRPDPDARTRVRTELQLGESQAVVLFAGRICQQKQPRVLAQTAARLRELGTDFVMLVAGDGPDMPWLRSFVQENALAPQVRLLGAVPPGRIKELLAAADVFFLPSQWEGIALSIYEALSSGVPVVGADVGGQRELVTSECGVLIQRGDENTEAEEYARVLSGLLSDLPRCRALGEEGRARIVRNFRIEQMVERMQKTVSKARDLMVAAPRPQPALEVARRCAFQAVESVRLFQLADWLWTQRNTENGKVRTYHFLARRLSKLYDWGIRRGWHWLHPLRARVRLAVLGR